MVFYHRFDDTWDPRHAHQIFLVSHLVPDVGERRRSIQELPIIWQKLVLRMRDSLAALVSVPIPVFALVVVWSGVDDAHVDDHGEVVHKFLEFLGSVGSSTKRGIVRFDLSRDKKCKDENHDCACMRGVIRLRADVDYKSGGLVGRGGRVGEGKAKVSDMRGDVFVSENVRPSAQGVVYFPVVTQRSGGSSRVGTGVSAK